MCNFIRRPDKRRLQYVRFSSRVFANVKRESQCINTHQVLLRPSSSFMPSDTCESDYMLSMTDEKKTTVATGTTATTTSVRSKEQNIKISNSKVGKERALNLGRMEQDLVKFKNIKKELDQDMELTIHQLQFTTTHRVKKCLMKSNKYIHRRQTHF